ncbi:two-component system, OmpR family, sensor histidine kinase KdpD [Paenibacillus algorifonticola]|uniref:Two-component system, OmpR family, sensor histidine kinase KdpD n=1 Tax=Paenibacillus algorifonticola TaxID=684063 RepID=A0A1I2G8P2_9BACL|nr:universal stress protein [Paenibacillus algorifonticola]SFF13975.1 two-component system, OmpR family, sensor histidine kinase KdpD [Paenibacillus algorifonticola]
MPPYQRKTPEEILASISRLHKGRLKIIIGSVAGSGKTYHLLQEGQLLKQQGIDVVICALTSATRTDRNLPELVSELEHVPSIRWQRDDKEQQDLPLETLLARNPEVVLVDGLAHRNRMCARFKTRLEDIQYLLEHGISIITTINVYELEGEDGVIFKMTGIRAEETVPADTLEWADEVRLIDVSPETMLSRMEEGLLGSSLHPAMRLRGNLAVLREVALCLMAEGVHETLEKHREALGLSGPSGAAERIVVSTQYHFNGSLYVRRGQQIAKRLHGELAVVTFLLPGRSLPQEQQTIKRSMQKLVAKVGGEFEELSLAHARKLPAALVEYATRHHATRIVMGHSKKKAWQERWQGSIVNQVLRKIRNIDVFVMTDRAEHEGERILPVKSRLGGQEALFHRLNSREMEEQAQRMRRGTFKIYIGAAPGVGKTYKMLQEGNILQRKGVDVVIGWLETHGRKETAEQVGDLTIVPRAAIPYGAVQLEEMDTAALIARRPEVVLVDELAHTNVPGSSLKKRYEDILLLLENGISVISTVNVQHVESLNDAVEQLTGVRVRETVPDAILQMASGIELIDVTPQMLAQRMRDGKIYKLEKVEQALGSFFKIGNLIALRELALREIADDVDERLESWKRGPSLRGPWRKREVIFVCVDLGDQAERLIRRGFRIAHRLKAEWHVHYVHSSKTQQTEAQQKRLHALRQLCERLGGQLAVSVADKRKEISGILLQKMNALQATQLIIGQSRRPPWQMLVRKTIVHDLLRSARHLDMLIVAKWETEPVPPILGTSPVEDV